VQKCTLSDLITYKLINELNFSEPMLMKNGDILYESGEGIEEDLAAVYLENKKRTLSQLNLASGDDLICEVKQTQDFVQNCRFHIHIVDTPATDPEAPLKRRRSEDSIPSPKLASLSEII
jgi:hypothetical protein